MHEERSGTRLDTRSIIAMMGLAGAMIGLLLWHQNTGDPKALACARRIGDLLCDRFLFLRFDQLGRSGQVSCNVIQE